ncbi:hypothetical protein FSP39_016401 [Pinctada imbricata]|uniref:UDENN FNIP1/2-type domain-containing protein n=1 Tax=Pinctada imbricata TaxID=66713 RepID=A0AA88XZB9_PINIB|nr:hypothetical protein FSP39_016401 [Pinctada imbricata]
MGLLQNIDVKFGSKAKNKGPAPKLDPSQIRLVIYHDSESCRQLIFDSKAVKRVEEFLKPGSDVKMLEEIMFGSVGMAYKGASVKVHFLRDEMVLTKVFIPTCNNQKRESHGRDSDLELDSFSPPIHSDTDLSCPRLISNSERSIGSIAQSVPVDVPSPKSAKFDIFDRDSGLASMTSSGSFHHQFPSPGSSCSSISSYSSLHRRWIRGVSTSIEGCLRKRNSHDNLVSQDVSGNSSSGSPRPKHTKVAMGILFGLCDDEKATENNQLFQNFLFSHITLFEGHLEKLRNGVEKAYYTRKRFVHIVMESLEKFQQDVVDLYTTPRLTEPVWLNMMCFTSYRYKLCEDFMKEFMGLVSKLENKNTHFFMSTLITAVLTHHLAWVPTVTPAGGTPSKTYLTNHSAKWVDILAKMHPYNPLWAQLGDLYGAIGYPIKVARTVIVGKKVDLVKKLLYILTYFIRCSDVQNKDLSSLENFIDEVSLDSPLDDKSVITPIEEVANQSLEQNVMQSSNCSDKMQGSCDTLTDDYSDTGDNLRQESVISTFEGSYLKQGDSQTSGISQTNYNSQEPSNVRPNSLPLSKQDSEKCRKSIGSGTDHKDVALFCDSINSDEGYCSIVQSSNDYEKEKSQLPCRLSDSEVREDVKVVNVHHVSKAVLLKETHSMEALDTCGSPHSSPNKRTKSMLTEKLSNKSGQESRVPTSEIRQRFLKEGSHSIFNEYFDDESIEAKTIDQVDEADRIVNHPLVGWRSSAQRMISHSVDNIPDASGSFPSQPDSQGHEKRLGSVGHMVRPRMSSISRQISTDRGRGSIAPGRCRSVTPTELSRRRHLSSTSSLDFDHMDPLVHFKELEMPKSVEIARTGTGAQPVVASQLVCNMLEGVQQLWKLKMSSEFCLMHLEDRLQEIYFKSKMLAEYLKDVKRNDVNMKELKNLLDFDTGDVPLLVAIAGTHSPHLSLGIIFAPLLEYLISTYGWRGAILILSGIVANTIVCAAVFRPLSLKSRFHSSSEIIIESSTTMIGKENSDDENAKDERQKLMISESEAEL